MKGYIWHHPHYYWMYSPQKLIYLSGQGYAEIDKSCGWVRVYRGSKLVSICVMNIWYICQLSQMLMWQMYIYFHSLFCVAAHTYIFTFLLIQHCLLATESDQLDFGPLAGQCLETISHQPWSSQLSFWQISWHPIIVLNIKYQPTKALIAGITNFVYTI
jgi:hypothetical protein